MADAAPRIIVFANLPPWVTGGAEHQTARLVEQWCRAGALVEVAGHRLDDGHANLGGSEVRTHRLRVLGGVGRAVRGASYLVSLLIFAARNRNRFDVAYCRGLADAVLGLSLAKALAIVRWPILAVPINAHGRGDAHFLRSVPGWRFWRRQMDRNVDAINLINAEIAGELDALNLKRASRHHIPNGVPVATALERSTVGRPRELLWTGRFEHQKGLDVLVDALRDIGDLVHGIRVTLIGEGPLRPLIAARVTEAGLSDVVAFAGHVPTADIRGRLASADGFLLPSRYEGMSNSVLEAMEAGLPVLCTECGGVDRVVAEGAGWTSPPGDVDGLIGALRQMLLASDEEWLEKGRTARRLVEQRFAIVSIADSNLDVLRGLAGGVR